MSGALPPGLSLDTSNGTISGTPTTAGVYNFTLRCKGANNVYSQKALRISVGVAPAITQKSLPDGVTGKSYSQTLTATGGKKPYLWSVVSGALPPGLALNGSSGAIRGTATAAGSFSFTIRCKGAGNFYSDRAFVITIKIPPVISTTSLADGMKGAQYNQTLTATGGKTPYTWSVARGALPSDLSLNAATGVISGTPAKGGTSSFTVRCRGADTLYSDQPLKITI